MVKSPDFLRPELREAEGSPVPLVHRRGRVNGWVYLGGPA